MKKINITKIVIALLIAFTSSIILQTSCKKDNQNTPIEKTLVLQKYTVDQYEVNSIISKSISLTQNKYIGVIGTVSTEFYKGNDTTLCFMTPGTISGTQQIKLTIDNVEYKVNLNINQVATIQDPTSYVNTYNSNIIVDLDGLESYINQLNTDSILNSTDAQSNLADIQKLKDSLNYSLQSYNNLSNSEKQIAAQVVRSNRKFYDNAKIYIDELISSKKKSQGLSFNQQLKKWCQAFTYTLVGSAIPVVGLGMIPELGTGGRWAGLAISIFIFNDVYKKLGLTAAKICYNQWAAIASETTENKSTYINHVSKSITFKIKHRNISESIDKNSSNADLKDFTLSYRKFIDLWTKYLTGYFSYLPKFADPVEKSDYAEDISYLPVQTNNSNVTGSLGGTASNLNVTFNTSQTTDQNFSYSVYYDNGIIQQISNNITSLLSTNQINTYSISIFSGNNQLGSLGSQLANPLKAIVKDLNGSPVAGVNVNFLASNSGFVSQSQVTTGSDGIASVTWTLGATGSTQTLTVTAYKNDNITPLIGSPLVFSTIIIPSLIADIDGNVYNTVIIGTQAWLKQNLKVTHYRNGDEIPNEIYNWFQLTTGAYCNYGDYTSYADIYGRIYDYYAVIDTRNLCPTGWHVPSNEEWSTLINYLGGESIAGGKLKEAGLAHWQSPNTLATNETGFTALPGGQRYDGGAYDYVGYYAEFWSSTTYDSNFADCITLQYSDNKALSAMGGKSSGIYVRCMKDQ